MKASHATLAARVVAWQHTQGRNHLPWQGTRDPYRVWLSEVMLQQTQVATVLGYFARFTERLPTVQALAEADEDVVLGLWSGLGYYSRARNLHRCARQVVEQWGGEFPRAVADLQALPGIGRSTAAAIASLCFGAREAILDANVKRVLTRVLGFGADLSIAANERALWHLAEQVLPRDDLHNAMPRYTQGMMDVGALLCTPKHPGCAQCPAAPICEAHLAGRPEDFPVRTRTIKRSAQSVWLLWLRSGDGRTWLHKRPASGVWAGLYCLPWFDSEAALREALPAGHGSRLRHLEVFKHVLTHKDLYLHTVCCEVAPQDLQHPQDVQGLPGRWVEDALWPGLGMPAPIRALLSQPPADQLCSQPKLVIG